MTDLNQYEQAAKATIDNLIQAGTTFDIAALDRIYHDSLQVISTDGSGQINLADKNGFKGLFAAKSAAGEAPLNNWSRYDHVQASQNNAHILIARKVNLTGTEQALNLSIDLVYDDDRWQVVREVIFASAA